MNISMFLNATYFAAFVIVLSASNAWADATKSKQVSFSCPNESCTAKLVETTVGKMFVVNAQVNGEEGTFLLDTGSSHLILTPAFSGRIFYNESDEEIARYKKIKDERDTVFRKASVVEIGDAQFSNVVVWIKDIEHISKVLEVRLDGILGGDILNRTVFKVDYSNNTLSFIKEDSSLDGHWTDIAINKRKFLIPSSIDGAPFLLLLDTGATTSGLSSSAFNQVEGEITKEKKLSANAHESKVKFITYKEITLINLGGYASLNNVTFKLHEKNTIGTNILRLGSFIVNPVSRQWQFKVSE